MEIVYECSLGADSVLRGYLTSLFVLDGSSHDASRKDEQTDVRGRTEDEGGGGKQ